LIIYLIRNDVVSPQKFDAGVVDTNYHHHSILSGNINGTWGTLINTGGLAEENTVVYNDFTYELPDPTLHPTFIIENLSLIAYLCDRNTYEVLQVIKSDI
jgi:Outer membrane protein Omp28.